MAKRSSGGYLDPLKAPDPFMYYGGPLAYASQTEIPHPEGYNGELKKGDKVIFLDGTGKVGEVREVGITGATISIKELGIGAWYIQRRSNGYWGCDSEHGYIRLFSGTSAKREQPKISLNSVIMPPKKIEEIRAAISQTSNEEVIFNDWGFDEVFEKGTAVSLLFWGIPGTGKTLTAQAIADEIGGTLKIVGTADIETSEPGGAERNIQQLFKKAREEGEKNKTVLVFDECDSLLMNRNEVGPIISGMINTLLQEIEKYEGVVIFTTNRLGKLDPALERRITSKVEFEFPTKEQRKEIWKRMMPKKAPLSKDVDFDHLAEFPLVGGNIKNSVLNATRMAAYKKLKSIDMQCFIDAIEKEMKSIQAFVEEYEKQDKTSIASHIARTGSGLVVDRKAVRKTVQEKASNIIDSMNSIGKKGGNS